VVFGSQGRAPLIGAVKRQLYVVFVLACAALTSCATEPIDYVLPDPDLSLDPAALSPQRIIYQCDKWVNGERPTDEKIFVDVSFDRRSESEPADHATSRHIAALVKHGGQVVYQFHFPAVRAWIATSEIPALSKEEPVVAILRIANLRRYDWNVGVGYLLPYSYEEGARRYAELGGRVDFRFNSFNAISGVLPDRSVETLRKDPNVQYAESLAPYPNPDCPGAFQEMSR
jgi:hypothetical protein